MIHLHAWQGGNTMRVNLDVTEDGRLVTVVRNVPAREAVRVRNRLAERFAETHDKVYADPLPRFIPR
jgi:hypothetical protein